MILGMSTAIFTSLHVVIRLVGIVSGLIVLLGWLTGKRLDGLTAIFLSTTALTSITGFFFPFEHVSPGIIVGIISLVFLAIAVPALYALHLAGFWRPVYVIAAAMALYLNVFVLVVQLFGKVSALKELAPTQKEPPFLIAQISVLLLFIVLAALATKKFRVASSVA